ncbi:MAG: hypothetical protein ABIF82_15200 [Planctomycetota bacterium]
MNSVFSSKASRAFTLCSILVVLAILALLVGLVLMGAATMRGRAELTLVASRANQLSTALRLYYQRHRRFPEAYPADLERDLGPYVDGADLFVSRAHPEAAAAPLNRSYVAPLELSDKRYVLSIDPARVEDRCVVLFGDAVVEIVEDLAVYHDGLPVESGDIVTGGVLRFTSGAAMGLSESTSVTVVRSFKANDGALFHIVKHDKGSSGSAEYVVPDDAVMEAASEPALVLMRGGAACATLSVVGERDRIEVSALSGEVIVDGRIIGAGQSADEGGTLLGELSFSPAGGDFHFVLTKPDGTTITRDDLLASKGDLEYSGPVAKLQFRGRSDARQNQLVLNNLVYPLEGGETYTIIASDMTVDLSNAGAHGAAMGRWRLDNLHATDARIIVGEDEANPDSLLDAASALGDLLFDENYRVDSGTTCRTLGRGAVVRPGKKVTAIKRR